MTDTIDRVFPCPRCKKSTIYDKTVEYRPFCSQSCKDDDTIRWADGDYSVAGEPAEPEELIDAIRRQSRDD